MIAKVAISFLSDDSDAELIVDSGRILAALTGNASYPTPNPTLTDVGAARTAFINAVHNLDGSSAAVAARDTARTTLAGLLRQLALYVQGACQNDLTVLLGSGFTAQKQRQPAGPLPAPSNLRLSRPEMSGQLKGRCDPVANASSYQWRITTSNEPANWSMKDPTTSASNLFEGLTPGTVYVVQGRAIGSAGPSDWSDPAVLMCV
jgi:hypothetical protein